MKANYKNFAVSAIFHGDKLAPWSTNNYNHNWVTVKNTENGKSTSFDFWGSLVNPYLETEYDLLNAFYCFVSDSLSGLESFDSFCADFGYDMDSRRAEKTWKACKRSFEKFKRISGFSESEMCDFANDLQDVAG